MSDADFLWKLTIVLGAVAGVVWTIVQIFRKPIMRHEQPIATTRAPVFARQEEVIALNTRLDRIERQIEADYRQILQSGHDRAERIHAAITTTADKIDARLLTLTNRINSQDSRLARIEGGLDLYPKHLD